MTPICSCSSGSDAGDQMPAPAHDSVGVGLAVFSSSAQVLYLDRPARRLLKRINLSEKGYATDGALPLILTELYDELLRVVCDRTKAQCWTCVSVKRVIPMQGLRMVLRGVGLPDRQGIERVRILLAMQEIDPCTETPQAHRAEQECPVDCLCPTATAYYPSTKIPSEVRWRTSPPPDSDGDRSRIIPYVGLRHLAHMEPQSAGVFISSIPPAYPHHEAPTVTCKTTSRTMRKEIG